MAAVVAIHTAEDATQASAAEARLCYTCGGVGHLSRDCVQGSKYYNCSGTVSRTRPLPSSADTNGCEQGHISKDCPQPPRKACYTCGSEGTYRVFRYHPFLTAIASSDHISRDCPTAGDGPA